MLEREEYVEQAFLFQMLRERLPRNLPLQDLLEQVAHELLATTKLPMAVQFMRSELLHRGSMWEAMARLNHYFTPYQTYVVKEAEDDRGRLDFRLALQVLEKEVRCRAEALRPEGLFMYQFETLCRNHMRYEDGLTAMSRDPAYSDAWKRWILTVRRQAGLVELPDLVYVRSELYEGPRDDDYVVLFGAKEGRIAMANRRKDPLFFFAALQRQLNYPAVPRPEPSDSTADLLPQMLRRMERLETRMKLVEEEQRMGAADLSRFTSHGDKPPPAP